MYCPAGLVGTSVFVCASSPLTCSCLLHTFRLLKVSELCPFLPSVLHRPAAALARLHLNDLGESADAPSCKRGYLESEDSVLAER